MKTNTPLQNLVGRVADRLSPRGDSSAPAEKSPRPLVIESLEPRIMFSGSPAPAPAPAPESSPAEAPAVQESTAGTAPEAASPVPEDSAVAAPPAGAESAPSDAGWGDTAITLTDTELAALTEAASMIWAASGISGEQASALASARYQIADLGGRVLGSAEGDLITIDDDAAGRGWFVDGTPEEDSEFAPGGTATTGVDLLSAVLHEQGHLLGLEDSSVDRADIMFELIGPGERRLPVAGEAAGAIAGSLEGAHFLTAAPGGVVTDPGMSNMELVYAVDDNQFDFNDAYTVDNSLSITPGYDRVGYFVELGNGTAGGPTDYWVWVSYDVATLQSGGATDPTRLGVPKAGTNIVENGTLVTNLHVETNHPNVIPGDFAEGIIEFWASNYNQNGGGQFGSDNGRFDWKDSGGSTGNGHGSFQVFAFPGASAAGNAQTLFGITGNGGAGIGDQYGPTGGNSPDWTFGPGTGTYAIRNLEIYVGLANESPVVDNLDGDTITYLDTDVPNPVFLDVGGDATVTDPDFVPDGGSIRVSGVLGLDASEDVLGISPAALSGGASVDLTENGSNGQDLVINLTATTTVADVQNMIRNVTYSNTTGANPLSRTLGVAVIEGGGSSSNVSEVTINMSFGGAVETYTWDGNSDLDGDGISWSDGNNWSAGIVPDANDIAVFTNLDLGDVTVAGNIFVGEIEFRAGSGHTLNGGNISITTIDHQGGTNEIASQITATALVGTVGGGTLSVSNTANFSSLAGGSWTVTGAELIAGAAGTESGLGAADVNLDGGTLSLIVGATVTPPDLGGVTDNLALWLDASDIDGDGIAVNDPADGAAVTAWADKSLNARDMIAWTGTPTYETNEIGGLPAVRFNANDENLQMAIPANTFFAHDVFLVFRAGQDGNGPTRTTFGPDWGAPIGVKDGNDANRTWMFQGNSDNFWSNELPSAVRWNGIDIPSANNFDMTAATGGASMGEYMVLNVTAGPNNGTQVREYIVGTRTDAWGNARFDTAEVIAYDQALGAADREAVEAYLRDKYEIGDLTATLPNSITVTGNSTISSEAGLTATLGDLTIADGATLNIDGNVHFGSTTTVGTATINVDGGTGLGGATLGGNVTINLQNGGSVDPGGISESVAGATVSYTGSGTANLDDSGDYTGLTTIGSGVTATVGTAGALGATDAATVVQGGGILDISGGVTDDENINLEGDSLLLKSAGGNVDLNGLITVTGNNAKIHSQGGNEMFLDGGITIQSGNTLQMEVDNRINVRGPGITGDATTNIEVVQGGNDVLDLEVTSNGFAGGISIDQGRIEAHDDNAIGTGTVTVLDGDASVWLRNSKTYANDFFVNGAGRSNEGAIRNENGDNTIDGTVTLTGDSTLVVNNTSLTITGTVGGAGFEIDKQGSGTLILKENNTFGNLALNQGAVRISKENGLGGTTSLTVDSGEALELDGTFNIDGGSNLSAFTFNGGSLNTVSGVQNFDITTNVTVLADVIFGGDGGTLIMKDVIGNGNGGGASAPSARFVQVIETAGTDTSFHLGELEVFGEGVTPNEAGGGSFGGLTTSTNDVADGTASTFNIGADLPEIGTENSVQHGDHNGVHDNAMQNGAAVWSTSPGQPTRPQYTLDLGAEFDIETLRMWPRADTCCTDRWGDLEINLYADDGSGNPGALVSTANVASPAGNVPHEIAILPVVPVNNLIKNGDSTVVLMADNTYNGDTMINAGTLTATNDGSLGLVETGTGTIVSSGATLAFDGAFDETDEAITVGTGTIQNIGGNTSITGTATLTGAVGSAGKMTIQSDADTLTVESDLNLLGLGLNLDGAGDIVVNGDISGSGSGVFIAAAPIDVHVYDGTNASITSADAARGSSTTAPPTNPVGDNGPGDTIPLADIGNGGPFTNNFAVPAPGGGDSYAVFLTGYLQVDNTNNPGNQWTFGLSADDDARIRIDLDQDGILEGSLADNVAQPGTNGETVVAKTNGCCQGVRGETITIADGVYLFEAVYTEGGGGDYGDFFYTPGDPGLATNGNHNNATITTFFVLLGDNSGGITTAAQTVFANEIMKLGTGTATLTGNNSYDGETTVMDGTLVVGSDTALGNEDAGTTVLAGATLALDNTNLGYDGGANAGVVDIAAGESLSINGNGYDDGGGAVGALRNIAGDNVISADVTQVAVPPLPEFSSTGLEAWYDASTLSLSDGDEVTAWADRSGNGRDLITWLGTPTFETNEIGGLPAVRFDASDENLQMADPANEYFAQDVFLLFRAGQDNGVQRARFGPDWGAPIGVKDGDDNDRTWMFQGNEDRFWGNELPSAVRRNGVDIPSANNFDMSVPTGGASMGEYMMLQVTAGPNNGTQDREYIVGTRTDAWGNARFDTAEIIAFDRTLSDAEREEVEYYLNVKYFGEAYLPAAAATITSDADTLTINGVTTFDELTFDGAGNTTVNGNLLEGAAGGSPVTKMGTGTLTIGSSNNATYTGDTTVLGGTLAVDGSIGGGTVTVTDGGAFGNTVLTGSGTVDAPVVAEANSIIRSGGGTLTLGDGSASAFTSEGKLIVLAGDTVVIDDAGPADLGLFNIIDGTLISANGITVSGGDNLSGSGMVNAAIFTTDYMVGHEWNRATDWGAGGETGSQTDSNGNPVWSYGSVATTDNNGAGTWYQNAGTGLVYDAVDGEWEGTNPDALLVNATTLRQDSGPDDFASTPVVYWTNPTGAAVTVDITGSFDILWAGAGGPAEVTNTGTAATVLGTGAGALLGNDLTDTDGVHNEGAYNGTTNLGGFDAIFDANDEPGFGGGEFSFNVFDDATGGGSDKWCCNQPSQAVDGSGLWVSAELVGTPKVLTHFTITSSNDSPGRDPDVWAIQGSNDGVIWTDIYAYSNDGTAPFSNARQEVLLYTSANGRTDLTGGDVHYETSTAYKSFRYFVDSTEGGGHALAELEFFGVDSVPMTPNVRDVEYVVSVYDASVGTWSDLPSGTGVASHPGGANPASTTGAATIAEAGITLDAGDQIAVSLRGDWPASPTVTHSAVDDFEDEASGSSTFTDDVSAGGPVFTLEVGTDQSVGAIFETFKDGSGFGAGGSNGFIDTYLDGNTLEDGAVGTITSETDWTFGVNSIDVSISTTGFFGGPGGTGDVTFRGTLAGGGEVVHTVEVTSSGTPYQTVNFSGTDFFDGVDPKQLSSLQVELPAGSNIEYVTLDNFSYTAETEVAGSPPASTPGHYQTLADNLTITLVDVAGAGPVISPGSLGVGDTDMVGTSVDVPGEIGTLSTGALTLGSGTTIDIDIDAAGHDQLDVTGAVGLNGAVLNLMVAAPFAAANGTVLVIVENDSSDPVTGTFDGIANGDYVDGGNAVFQLFYDSDSSGVQGAGNDVVLVVANPTIEFSSANFNDDEGAGTTTVVTLTRIDTGAGLNSASSVSVAITGGSATGGAFVTDPADYDNTNFAQTVNFAAGQTSATVSLTIFDDTITDANETITFEVTGTSNATIGNQSTTTFTIDDNDTDNQPPMAVDDGIGTIIISEDAGATDITGTVGTANSGVLGNDSDPDGDPLTITAIDDTGITKGTLTLNAGVLSYDPNSEFDSLAMGETDTTQTFIYTIDDGNGVTDSATATITINGLNDAPVLAGANDFDTVSEDDTANGGQMVSEIAGGFITDADGGSVEGIAITAATSSSAAGTWQFSTDGGGSWADVGAVSETSGLLLRDSDLVRYLPDGTGVANGSITFKAWDQTGGTSGGEGTKVTTLPDGSTEPSSAFSADTATSGAEVTEAAEANSAPVLTGANDFDPVSEDDVTNMGQPVVELVGDAFGDFITDADTGSVEGIAITGATSSSAAGTFQFSTDGGGVWTDVGAVSETSGLLLRDSDLVRYLPDGTGVAAGSITFKAWDQTGSTSGGEGTKVTTLPDGSTEPSSAFSADTATSGAEVVEAVDADVFVGGGTLTYREVAGRSDVVTIYSDGTNLIIHDDAGPVTAENPSWQVDANTVSVPLSDFEDILFEANDLDDTITVGDMPGFDGSLTIDGGEGFDTVTFAGGMTLALGTGTQNGTDENLDVDAETVKIDLEASLSVVGGGTIDITAAGGGAEDFVGIHLRGASLSSEGGAITLEGEGGSSGNHNDGVQLSHGSSITTGGGSVSITGTATGVAGPNDGVSLVGGSDITVGGAGTITITGTSSGVNDSYGVLLLTGTELTSGAGEVSVTGSSASTGPRNSGVYTNGATVTSAGGSITLDGSGGGSGGGGDNKGLRLTATTIGAGGSGGVTLTGTGGSGTSTNVGVEVGVRTEVTTASGDIVITGTGGAGTGVRNRGAEFQSDSRVISGGSLTIAGTSGGGTAGNEGVYGLGATLETTGSGALAIVGTGGGSADQNTGVSLGRTAVAGAGDVSIRGTGSVVSSGRYNDGVSLTTVGVTAGGDLLVVGDGGTGGDNNRGVYGNRVTIEAASYEILGRAHAATTGGGNAGVSFSNSTFSDTGTISGTGGGGTGTGNYGVYLHNVSSGMPVGNATGTAEDEDEETGGNYFNVVLPALVLAAGADRVGRKRRGQLAGLIGRLGESAAGEGEMEIYRESDGVIGLEATLATVASLEAAGVGVPDPSGEARRILVLTGDGGVFARLDAAGKLLSASPLARGPAAGAAGLIESLGGGGWGGWSQSPRATTPVPGRSFSEVFGIE